MNWALILLAWLMGRWSSGRDLTTWSTHDSGPTTPPPAPPRPASPRPASPRPAPTTPVSYPAPSTPPWPQVIPAGLPPFPGGWEPDSPVGAGVAARAAALLPELWTYGAGTRKTEQTEGRWITYVATPMGEGRRGVVAFRPRPGFAPSPPVSPSPREESPTAFASTAHYPLGARILRDEERPTGSDVSYVQGRLGVPATGVYDAATVAAVRAYQRAHPPLDDDGDVGPLTWKSLLAVAV